MEVKVIASDEVIQSKSIYSNNMIEIDVKSNQHMSRSCVALDDEKRNVS